MAERTAQRLAQLVAVVLRQSGFGCSLVQSLRLKDEAQVVEVGCGSELIHFVQCELHVRGVGRGLSGTSSRVEQHLLVLAQENEVRVCSLYPCLSLLVSGAAHHVDIQLVGVLVLERDMYAVFGDECLAALHVLLLAVAQHFQLQFRLAHERAEGYGNGQTDHSRAGDAYAHGVFEDVGAESHFDMPGHGAQQFCSFRHAQCHGDRFGAADGRNHLPVHQFKNGFFL